ncbi:TonB-dependent receptor domain-containing protein [Chryseobacterium sp. PMSZPI]|uniref:TonB-dependent receptor domain-containing protein n=1 Tax=Chryseobacterium sp. PMSZPI TaxID=1033900 RepID=UPI000C34755C|nr:TonB-dependent receptor [Chryseobacterium sp. PMSZPI]PKF72873.1 TonB-dependent receptor [Chryseobacterium sp. PMSZPI]
MTIKLSITTLFFLGINTLFNAQSISGKITNNKGEAIPYAEVSAEYQKEKFYTLTNASGNYTLKVSKNNDYTLNVFNNGAKVYTHSLTVRGDINKDVIVNEEVKEKEIQGVVLTSRKKIIEQKVDRMVFNLENSIASQGMSGADALRNTPLIRMDDQQGISIVGKSGVSVMINGKMLNLSGSELTNYLQSLRSDDISKIEVITTPPAKYEAQGNSGLINIILKKNTNFGWSGSLNTSYQRNTKDGFRNGININYRTNKLNSSLKLRHYDNGYSPVGSRDLISDVNKIFTEEKREDRTYGLGLNYSLDYEINKSSNVGVIYDYGSSRYTMDSYNKSSYFTGLVSDSTLNTHAMHKWKTPTHTLSVYYDLKLDTLGKKLSVVGNLLNNQPNKTNNFVTTNLLNLNESIVRNESLLKYNVLSGQADLSLPYDWGTVETGGKYTFLKNKSNVGYYEYLSGQYVIIPENSNVFDYEEQNYALYASFEKKFGKKWTAKAGLRYEYTTLEGTNDDQNNIKNNYGKFFPSLYLSYNPNANHSLSVKYSRRITRPDFQSLNPFRWYTNPYIYYTGNSSLQPSFNDNVEISYTFKNKLTVSIYNQYTQNGYSSIARLLDGVYSNRVENSYDQNKIGVNLSYYDTFFKVWEFSASMNASNGRTSPLIPELQEISVNSFLYSFYNTIAVNKSKTVFVMLNFWHSLPFTFGSTYVKDQLEFSPGIKASLFNKQLQLSAVLSDAFRTVKNNGYTEYSGYRENFNQYNDYRRFTFSLTYVFGNSKVKGASKNIKFDEKSRAN